MSKKVIEYKVVRSESPEGLQAEVNKLLKDDFQPFGGFTFGKFVPENNPQRFFYFQAVVRFE